MVRSDSHKLTWCLSGAALRLMSDQPLYQPVGPWYPLDPCRSTTVLFV